MDRQKSDLVLERISDQSSSGRHYDTLVNIARASIIQASPCLTVSFSKRKRRAGPQARGTHCVHLQQAKAVSSVVRALSRNRVQRTRAIRRRHTAGVLRLRLRCGVPFKRRSASGHQRLLVDQQSSVSTNTKGSRQSRRRNSWHHMRGNQQMVNDALKSV